MARGITNETGLRRLLWVTLAALVVLCAMPARVLSYLSPAHDALVLLVAPVSGPIRWILHAALPAQSNKVDIEAAVQLRLDRDHYRALYEQQLKVSEELRTRIVALQRGFDANPALPVRQMTAPVIGYSTDAGRQVLMVRAGKEQGVEINTVAVAEGMQILGRVIRSGTKISFLLPITARDAGRVLGAVEVGEGLHVPCELVPDGKGGLSGRLGEAPSGVRPPAPGDVVRLDDRSWPANAQMFELGVVVSIGDAPDSALRKIVTVTPSIPLDRIAEVVLRITLESEQGGGDGG